MTKSKLMGVSYTIAETTEEANDMFHKLESNPNFTYIGFFDEMEEIIDYLYRQGFYYGKVKALSNARSRDAIEIIYCGQYEVFIGSYQKKRQAQ